MLTIRPRVKNQAAPMTETLPVFFAIDGALHEALHASAMRELLARMVLASVHDMRVKLEEITSITPQICCTRPWTSLRQLAIPCYPGKIRDLLNGQSHYARGLVIAIDTPTVPRGYLQVASDAILAGKAARVYGASLQGNWYLFGWGTGSGHVSLPPWYRLFEEEGIARVKRDLQRGCRAPATGHVMACVPEQPDFFPQHRLQATRTLRFVTS